MVRLLVEPQHARMSFFINGKLLLRQGLGASPVEGKPFAFGMPMPHKVTRIQVDATLKKGEE